MVSWHCGLLGLLIFQRTEHAGQFRAAGLLVNRMQHPAKVATIVSTLVFESLGCRLSIDIAS